MAISTSAFIALMLGFAGPPAETPWEDIIRDVQIANMSTIQGGRFRFRSAGMVEGWKGPVRIEGEFAWSGDSSFTEFHYEDPGGVLLGLESKDLEQSSTVFLMQAGSADYAFDPSHKRLIVQDRDRSHHSAMLELHPEIMWFRCCPPSHKGEGRPWPEMVGPLPAASTGGIIGSVEFKELGPELIRQIRHDPSGFVVEIDFSLRDCGLPVRTRSSAPPGASLRTARGEFRWKHVGKSCVIESIDFHRFAPGKPDHEIESFQIEVRDVVLKPEPSRFTESYLLKRIPGGFTVDDRRTDPKRKRIAPRVSEPDYSESAKELLDRGFLKEKK